MKYALLLALLLVLPGAFAQQQDIQPITIPIIGEVPLGGMSSVVATLLIATTDGFNPCSLWVLTFLLGIVVFTKSRKKVLLIGGTFLAVTALTYGLFIGGMLHIMAYMQHMIWVQSIVATIAIAFGIINIKDFFWYKKGISLTIADSYKPTFFKRVRNIMHPDRSIGSLLVGTIIMALGITIIELPCTAAMPIIWGQVIMNNNTSTAAYIMLLMLYLLVYLLIEIIILTIALVTLKSQKFEQKQGRILKLIGGMIMLALGGVLLIRPSIMESITSSLMVFGIAIASAICIALLYRFVKGDTDG